MRGAAVRTLKGRRALVTDEGSALIAPHIARLADAEGMAGHAITARLRLPGTTL